jgi:hypothetical protein
VTQQEIEAELATLRDRVGEQRTREEMRRKNWLSNGKAAMIASSLYGLIAAGCFVARGMFPGASSTAELGHIGLVFIVTASALNLLGASLRDPVSRR